MKILDQYGREIPGPDRKPIGFAGRPAPPKPEKDAGSTADCVSGRETPQGEWWHGWGTA